MYSYPTQNSYILIGFVNGLAGTQIDSFNLITYVHGGPTRIPKEMVIEYYTGTLENGVHDTSNEKTGCRPKNESMDVAIGKQNVALDVQNVATDVQNVTANGTKSNVNEQNVIQNEQLVTFDGDYVTYVVIDETHIECAKCKKHMTPSNMKRHTKVCKQFPNNTCSLCAKEYKHRSGLSRHLKMCRAKHQNNEDSSDLLAITNTGQIL